MGTKSRDRLYGSSVRMAAERAAEARREADRLACEAWTKRMLAFKGPAQPSPSLGDALNAGYLYLEVHCLGCDTHQTVALDIIRRPKSTPIHELERYMRCNDCSRDALTASSCRIHLLKIEARLKDIEPPDFHFPERRPEKAGAAGEYGSPPRAARGPGRSIGRSDRGSKIELLWLNPFEHARDLRRAPFARGRDAALVQAHCDGPQRRCASFL
jgi:hypothetical protein